MTPPISSSPGAASSPATPPRRGRRRSPSAATGSSPSGPTPTSRPLIGPQHPRHRAPGTDRHRGLPGRARPPDPRRPRPHPVRAPRVPRQGRVPAHRRRVRRGQPGPRVDPRRRLVARRLPRWPAPARGPRPGRPRPAGASSPTATATMSGSTPGRSSSPGITADTPDPDDGRIARDPDGTPIGTLHEGAADLVQRLVPETTVEDFRTGLLEGQRYLHSLGITAWQDAWVAPGDQAAYVALAESGELTARVIGALWWDRSRGHGADRRHRRAARRRPGRPLPGHERQAHVRRDHREPDGGDAPAVLRDGRHRRRTTPAWTSSMPRR